LQLSFNLPIMLPSKLLARTLKTALALAGLSFGSSAFGVITITFEGLQNEEGIGNFYNGGTGSLGSSGGPNYGVSFSPDALALIDADAGGSGNFGNEPTPDTIMFFSTGNTAVLNFAAGFDTGFSFYYTAIFQGGSIGVYSGVNKTGSLLATLVLPVTPVGVGDPNGSFNVFVPIGVSFAGIAQSIDFGGAAGQIGFDNITFGAVQPGTGANPVPEPSTYGALAGLGLIALVGARRFKRAA
jgi:hypothetical protein